MKFRHLILWMIAATLTVQSVQSEPAQVVSQIAKANNEFAFDLFARLAKQPGNLVVSPFSIETALAMNWAGARGETARQMASVLHLPSGDTNVHAGFSALLKDLKDTNTLGCQLDMANALWAQKGYPILESFQKLLQVQYGTALKQTDLNGDSAKARAQINSWVAGQTRDKIQEILPPAFPSPETQLILVNAIWFKGLWATPFDNMLTKHFPFHLDSGKSVSVPTMQAHSFFNYAENITLQVLEMPYYSNQLSMMILLPKKSEGLPEIEKTLTVAQIEQMHRTSHRQEVDLFLPKFKIASGLFRLDDLLITMGMRDAFIPGLADLSGITADEPFFIEAVFQNAYVDVDEKGTEAAAATGVNDANGIPIPVSFNADHPFLFLIRHNPTGAILFLGRVANPLSNGQ